MTAPHLQPDTPDNKKDQHRWSVETLGLSGNDDERIIAEITDLINGHQRQQPNYQQYCCSECTEVA